MSEMGLVEVDMERERMTLDIWVRYLTSELFIVS